MKILSSIANLFKKGERCVVPELTFGGSKVKRTDRKIKRENSENKIIFDFANAYLSRVRSTIKKETGLSVSWREDTSLPRRALKCERVPMACDELDNMIIELSNLGGLNVAERARYLGGNNGH